MRGNRKAWREELLDPGLERGGDEEMGVKGHDS